MGNEQSQRKLPHEDANLRRSKRSAAKSATLRMQKQCNDHLWSGISLYGKHYYNMSDYDFIENTSENNSIRDRHVIKYMWLPRAGFKKEFAEKGIVGDIGVPLIWSNLDGALYVESFENILDSLHDFIHAELNKENIKRTYDKSEYKYILNAMKFWRKKTSEEMNKYQKSQIILLDPLHVAGAQQYPLARISNVSRREFNCNIRIIHLQCVDNKLKTVTNSGGSIDKCAILKSFANETEAIAAIKSINDASNNIKESKSAQEMEENARRIGIDIDMIKRKAKKEGHIECAKVEVQQKLIYLCTQANGKLTATISKRKPRPTTGTKITLNSMNLTGFETFQDLSSSYEKEGVIWYFNGLDYLGLAEIVGMDLLYKYKNGKQVYYADDIDVQYSTFSHAANMTWTNVRWTPAAKHRHRVIPPLN